jgi:hypothetical protein
VKQATTHLNFQDQSSASRRYLLFLDYLAELILDVLAVFNSFTFEASSHLIVLHFNVLSTVYSRLGPKVKDSP